jgi:hypothetical protein
MPSTYSPDLRIELIANGEQSGTWGSTTNSNLGTIIEDAISGLATVTISSSNQALTALNGAADQARCAAVALTGGSAPFNLFVPPVTKLYVIKNNTAYSASVYCSTVLGNTTAAGAGVDVHAGKSALVRSDGTNVVDQLNYVSDSFEIGTTLTVNGASTLTGAATFGSTVTLNANPTLALQAATKQYVDSAASASFPVGGIIMWSGSVVSIPAGWALCNGSNGTPDLRDRFIVGAGSTYAVAATGGSKDAIVVGHTHSASSSVSDPGHTHTYLGTVGPSGTGESSRLSVPSTRTTNIAYTGISVSTSISPSGSSGTDANLPPYYALAYIMKT